MKTAMKPLAALAFCGVSAIALSAGAFAQQSNPSQANPPTRTDSSSQGAPTLGIGEKTGVNSLLGITPTTTDFVKEAATSDMFEIQSSQLALQQGEPDAKTFAQKMIDDHMRTTNELKSMVQSQKIQVEMPTALTPSLQSMLDGLKSTSTSGRANTGAAMGTAVAPSGTGMANSNAANNSTTANSTVPGGSSNATAGGANNAADFTRRYFDDQTTSHKTAVDLFERYSKGGDNAELKSWAEKNLPALRDHLKMAQDMSNKYNNSGRTGANSTGGAGSGAMGAGGAGMGTTGMGTTGTGAGPAGAGAGAGGGAGTTTGR